MSRPYCEREEEAARCVSAPSPDLAEHLKSCEICAEVLTVSAFLQNSARRALAGTPMPSADVVWRKTMLTSRRAAKQRALWPISVINVFALTAAALIVVWLMDAGVMDTVRAGASEHALSGSWPKLMVGAAIVAIISVAFASMYMLWPSRTERKAQAST